jgi:hypothetical protein
MNYQRLMIVGNITADAETKTSKKGDVNFTTFRVAVGDPKGDTTFFPVTLFGTRGEKLSDYLTKGRQVTVDGRVTISDKGFFNMIADRIELGVKPNKKEIPVVRTDTDAD